MIIDVAVSSKVINTPSGDIGYIKVKVFSKIMPEELRKKIVNLRNKNIGRIILDLRNNPGGELCSALDILSYFARSGYVSMVMRERDEKKVFYNKETGDFAGLKVVVLINKGSASASEIFAGAMKDWGSPIVGVRSFGKGVGQSLIPLNDGSILRLTTFEFLVGNSETKINNIGATPTYEVTDENEQLKKAIEILSH